MHSEVGISPQSLPYWFQNEIIDHPYSDGSSRSYRIECTKFNEGCTKLNEGYTKFCEGCTKGLKMRSEVGIGPKSLYYGFLNEIMAHSCSDGGLGIIRLGCTKFNEGCTKFCE